MTIQSGFENRVIFIETTSINLLPAPPIPPRQIKSDEKTTPPLVLVKQSHPVNSSLIDHNKVKGLSIYSKIMNENFYCSIGTSHEVISNGHHIGEDTDQILLIQTSPTTLPNG